MRVLSLLDLRQPRLAHHAPLPSHVRELLVRGRTADGARAEKTLGTSPEHTTSDVVRDLFEWASVTYLRGAEDEDA